MNSEDIAKNHRDGEYRNRGDYHLDLDPDWSYTPLFRRKTAIVDRFVSKLPKQTRILDVGAGEGWLVERYRNQGYDVTGIDPNYGSELVQRGSILSLPHQDGSCEVILCLDVLEHIQLLEQPRALREMHRVLSEGGTLLLSLPNLAHLHSRIRFLLSGRLTRTSAIERHPGDRPVEEHIELLQVCGFRVISRQGVFPTVPLLFRLVNRKTARMGWLVPLLDWILPFPGLCFLNILVAVKQQAPDPA
jgi:SAM-dependent methyltransferase